MTGKSMVVVGSSDFNGLERINGLRRERVTGFVCGNGEIDTFVAISTICCFLTFVFGASGCKEIGAIDGLRRNVVMGLVVVVCESGGISTITGLIVFIFVVFGFKG